MVRLTTRADLERDLVNELLAESNIEDRCPHLREDSFGCYCSKNLDGPVVLDVRRRVCDTASLQLWCLDKERYNICIWYNGEPFIE